MKLLVRDLFNNIEYNQIDTDINHNETMNKNYTEEKVTLTIEQIHLDMIKSDEGFPDARDENGEVIFVL